MSVPSRRQSRHATLWGATTVLNWATLALFTQWAGPVPPFLLTALCFGLAGGLAMLAFLARGDGPALGAAFRQPPAGWALGIGGLFGYHLCYFIAQQNAPPANAGLISYLWPLLIVILAGLVLPGERLRGVHLLGGACGFLGAGLLVGPEGFDWAGEYTLGYLAALTAALIWSGYSVASRLLARIPTTAVAWNCLGAAVLALACHLAWEPIGWPDGANPWAILALGLGPVGSAFFTWDLGMKRGRVRLLGLLAYATPLCSTLVLVAAGLAEPSPSLWLAALLICGGALVGSGSLRLRRSADEAGVVRP
ncbi:DMT family transporter [Halomonas beimenensis]|uniref:Permease of the drug/metabolite transporter (DMT) superfamily n=1 Tax=Halomonas beimenensis TaxID=475662 RepID=A0A291P6M0_9GAMM|nr:DMT family transporter [Halomonas beimenensis]ATJ82527.1 permease of the drug/metabolite transporter (DMT) superfamily [Halomonas beimenensis]